MHMRGKDLEMRSEYPTGESETMLKVPNYSLMTTGSKAGGIVLRRKVA